MTYIDLVNKVLRRLREEEVSSVTETDYVKFVGEMVNETKREVEDAWDWTVLRQQISITTAAGDFDYTLTGAGNRFRVLREPETGAPSVYNTTDQYRMMERSPQWIRRIQGTSTVSQQDPSYYAFEGQDSNGDPNVLLYATPDGVKTIEFNLIVPQATLTANTNDMDVPEWPVIIGSWARCISERGEDGGTSYNEADAMYRSALNDAIAQDAGRTNDETVWKVE